MVKTDVLLGVTVHTCKPSSWETEVGGLPWVWGEPRLHSKFQTTTSKQTTIEKNPESKRPTSTQPGEDAPEAGLEFSKAREVKQDLKGLDPWESSPRTQGCLSSGSLSDDTDCPSPSHSGGIAVCALWSWGLSPSLRNGPCNCWELCSVAVPMWPMMGAGQEEDSSAKTRTLPNPKSTVCPNIVSWTFSHDA